MTWMTAISIYLWHYIPMTFWMTAISIRGSLAMTFLLQYDQQAVEKPTHQSKQTCHSLTSTKDHAPYVFARIDLCQTWPAFLWCWFVLCAFPRSAFSLLSILTYFLQDCPEQNINTLAQTCRTARGVVHWSTDKQTSAEVTYGGGPYQGRVGLMNLIKPQWLCSPHSEHRFPVPSSLEFVCSPQGGTCRKSWWSWWWQWLEYWATVLCVSPVVLLLLSLHLLLVVHGVQFNLRRCLCAQESP